MSESVSVEMFKIWSDSLNTLLGNLHLEIKAIASEQKEIVSLVKEDVATTKSILNQHIIEYNNDKKHTNVRFKNLFQRQDKMDGILIERAPVFLIYKGISKGVKIFIIALIIAAASAFIAWLVIK